MIIYMLGGGDLASGVAVRLHRAGLRVVIAELPQPLVVRRLVSFANAIFENQTYVEDIQARKINDSAQLLAALDNRVIPVAVDPHAQLLETLRAGHGAGKPIILIDGRMTKQTPDLEMGAADLVIGLGPGFIASVNCHAVIETNRGHTLGRVIWEGPPLADTGVPESINRQGISRVLRAHTDGPLVAHAEIGERLSANQLVAEVAGKQVLAPFNGVLRGLIFPGVQVTAGLKIGDVDPRNDPRYCRLVSDKALSIGGGVLEAILARQSLRPYLWD